MNNCFMKWEQEDQRDALDPYAKIERLQDLGEEMLSEINRLRSLLICAYVEGWVEAGGKWQDADLTKSEVFALLVQAE